MSDFARSSAAPARNEDEGGEEKAAGKKEKNDDAGERGLGGPDRRSGREDHCRMEELWCWNETRTELFVIILLRS